MDWIESRTVWGLRPELAEVFVGGKAFEGLESWVEVAGSEEVVQVRFELVVGVVEVSLDRSVLDGSVHAFDLPVAPPKEPSISERLVQSGDPAVDSCFFHLATISWLMP